MIPEDRFDFYVQRDFTQIFNSTFAYVRTRFRRGLGKCLLYFAGPLLFVSSVFYALYMDSSFNLTDISEQDFSAIIAMIVYVIVASLASIGASVMMSTTLCEYMILDRQRGLEGFEIFDVWEAVKISAPRIFGYMALFVLAAIILYIPIVGIIAGAAILSGFLAGFLGAILFIGLAILLIYAVVTLSLFVPIVIFERKDFMQALRRARELTRNNWWITFALIITAGALSYFLSSIFNVPLYGAVFGSAFLDESGAEVSPLISVAIIAVYAITTFGSLFLASIVQVIISMHYFSLVERHDAPGLMTKISQLGNPEMRTNDPHAA